MYLVTLSTVYAHQSRLFRCTQRFIQKFRMNGFRNPEEKVSMNDRVPRGLGGEKRRCRKALVLMNGDRKGRKTLTPSEEPFLLLLFLRSTVLRVRRRHLRWNTRPRQHVPTASLVWRLLRSLLWLRLRRGLVPREVLLVVELLELSLTRSWP